MKKSIILLSFAYIALVSCNKSEMEVTPTQTQPAVQPATESQDPIVLYYLNQKFQMAYDLHAGCLTYEQFQAINWYLMVLAYLPTPPATDNVLIEVAHIEENPLDEVCKITFDGVTVEFYTDGTSNWSGDIDNPHDIVPTNRQID